jgi:hypothetical protein
MAIIIGVIMMITGGGVVFSGRVFPAQREIVERCGIYVFLAGLGLWTIAWAIDTFAA